MLLAACAAQVKTEVAQLDLVRAWYAQRARARILDLSIRLLCSEFVMGAAGLEPATLGL